MSVFAELSEKLQATIEEIIAAEPNDLEQAGLRAAANLQRFYGDTVSVNAASFVVMLHGGGEVLVTITDTKGT